MIIQKSWLPVCSIVIWYMIMWYVNPSKPNFACRQGSGRATQFSHQNHELPIEIQFDITGPMEIFFPALVRCILDKYSGTKGIILYIGCTCPWTTTVTRWHLSALENHLSRASGDRNRSGLSKRPMACPSGRDMGRLLWVHILPMHAICNCYAWCHDLCVTGRVISAFDPTCMGVLRHKFSYRLTLL